MIAVIRNEILMEVYAHSRADAQMDNWQTLQDHCKAVAELPEACAGKKLISDFDGKGTT